MNYEQTKNKVAESEILSADEQKLSALLGGLKRVEAPKDFDFKLKARIAAASPADERKPFLFPGLRYVLPLCLVVMLSAFAALKIVAPGDAPNTPSVAGNFQPPRNTEVAASNLQEKPIGEPAQTNANSTVNNDASSTVKSPKPTINAKPTLVAAAPAAKRAEKAEIKSRNVSEGVRESAAKVSRVINMNPNERGSQNPNSERSGKISIREVLSEIGIEVEFVGTDCKVKSVREGTAARIANFQPGDLIQAIDDKKLSSEMTFLQSFTGKVFRIVRDGKQIVIDLTKK